MSEPAVALVLSGGGAFAAYEVGVLRALVEGASPANGHRPVMPRVITGTSAGAYNAALVACRAHRPPAEAVAEVERVWLEEVSEGACGNGVFRWRGSPFNFLDWRCALANPLRFFWERVEDVSYAADTALRWFAGWARRVGEDEERRTLEVFDLSAFISTHPFPDLIRRTVDFEALHRSPQEVRIAATNWENGELQVFDNRHMTPSRGPLIVMASSAIPSIFPPISIPPAQYVDGGLLMNTPLSPAIHAGATELHVVYLDPEIDRIPLAERQSTLGALQRTLAIAMAGIMDRDVAAARRINHALDLYERYRRGEIPRDAGELFQVIEQVESRLSSSDRSYHRLTIHRYRPHELLGGALGLLEFRRDHAERLIEQGYRDAVHHDCADCECVVSATGEGSGEDREVAHAG